MVTLSIRYYKYYSNGCKLAQEFLGQTDEFSGGR